MWWTLKSRKSQNTYREEEVKFLGQHEEELCGRCRTSVRSERRRNNITLAAATTIIILLICDIAYRMHSQANVNKIEPIAVPVNKTSPQESLQDNPYVVDNGFVSELPALRKLISFSPQNYTGMLTWSPETKKAMKTPDGPERYFGSPTDPLVDQAWKKLLDHEFPILYDHEIEPSHLLEDKDRMWYDDKIHFEPDVFHSLHCLNAIRQQVNHVLYPEVPLTDKEAKHDVWDAENVGENFKIIHIEHCMDRIRQSLMCHPDLTPSPLKIFPNFPIAIGMTGERICRDWDPIRKWMDDRFEEGLALVDKEKADKERLNKEKEESQKDRSS